MKSIVCFLIYCVKQIHTLGKKFKINKIPDSTLANIIGSVGLLEMRSNLVCQARTITNE